MITIDCGDDMNNVYDFNWVVNEIDQCIVLKLVDNDKTLGIYQASEIGYDLDDIEVRFANVADLIRFINHSGIVFRDVSDSNNVIRIPTRKILVLFNNSNKLGNKDDKNINTNTLEAFIVHNNEQLKNKCQIKSYKVNEESEELKEIMDIAYRFGNMGMQDTIEALEKVNLVNYHKTSRSA